MQLVIGAGEVGKALAEVLGRTHNTQLRDVEPPMLVPTTVEAMHICFPWSSTFADFVRLYQRQYEPKLTVIHSTVPVGTSDSLGAVHSPIRGRHPNLTTSIWTFVKWFGGAQAREAADIFEACGCEVKIAPSAWDTEAGKLWELAQFGLQVVIEKAIFEYCLENGLDFGTVYTQFAATYNQGYEDMGEPRFTRPVLKHIPGPIGGHCVVPGSAMLDHPLADLVARFNDDSQGLSQVLDGRSVAD